MLDYFLLRIVYQFGYAFFLFLGGPVYLYKKRKKVSGEVLLRRCGFFSIEEEERLRKIKKSIWIQAVSVGEVLSLRPLVEKLAKKFPDLDIVITSTTATGYKLARSLWPGNAFYFPLDSSFIVKRFITRINPVILVIFETEIWPEVIWQMKDRRCPVILVNGRISDQSYPRYKNIRWFLQCLLDEIDVFLMQSQKHCNRIIYLGAYPGRVFNAGNIKYESSQEPLSGDQEKVSKSLETLFSGRKILLAASTHDPEEEIIIKVYKQIREKFQDLDLIIAPRHPERSLDVSKYASKEGFKYQFYSSGWSKNEDESGTVFIMDKIGFLRALYKLSCVSFVGGSLAPYGGHNILEAAYFSKPVIAGPHFHNFEEIVKNFVRHDAMVIVRNSNQLIESLEELLSSDKKRIQLGKNAENVLAKYKNISDVYVNYIEDFIFS